MPYLRMADRCATSTRCSRRSRFDVQSAAVRARGALQWGTGLRERDGRGDGIYAMVPQFPWAARFAGHAGGAAGLDVARVEHVEQPPPADPSLLSRVSAVCRADRRPP